MARPRVSATPDTPKVLDKAIRVLELFDGPSPERSESDIARELGLPRTTVNRILRGFEQRSFLVLLPGGSYRLGPAVIRLGRRAAATLDYASLLRPRLEQLAADTRELVILAVPEPDTLTVRYAAVIDSPHRLRVTADVGLSIPITAGASAKALLAFLPDDVVERVLARPITPLAAGTRIAPDAVRDDLAGIRERGYAFSWEETFDGAWAVAAPVVDADGTAVAAIGVATPTTRHSRIIEQAIVTAVRSATAAHV
jgi:DNA-binding IclR family transcriptional regulator